MRRFYWTPFVTALTLSIPLYYQYAMTRFGYESSRLDAPSGKQWFAFDFLAFQFGVVLMALVGLFAMVVSISFEPNPDVRERVRFHKTHAYQILAVVIALVAFATESVMLAGWVLAH